MGWTAGQGTALGGAGTAGRTTHGRGRHAGAIEHIAMGRRHTAGVIFIMVGASRERFLRRLMRTMMMRRCCGGGCGIIGISHRARQGHRQANQGITYCSLHLVNLYDSGGGSGEGSRRRVMAQGVITSLFTQFYRYMSDEKKGSFQTIFTFPIPALPRGEKRR